MDISEMISSLTPGDIEQLKDAANAILGEQEHSKEESSVLHGISPSMLTNLGKVSKALSGDDERTALLKALKPMLSEERQEKADEAIKILKLLQLMPLLHESGLLKGLL